MIVSDSKKFIFSHLYKTAGTSIRTLLSPYGKQNIYGCEKHSSLKEIKKNMPPELFNSYYKFTFVRSTWSWQVSLYEYMLKDFGHPQHQLMKTLGNFDNYVYWRVDGNVDLQKEYVYDENGKLLADFIGKFDTLTEDVTYLCDKFTMNNSLSHLNNGHTKNYKEYYTETTKKIFADAYKEDIKTFNFKF